MSYKMIVLDIDDTLLCSKHFILPETKESLINAQKNGIKVVLCSGRPTVGMTKFIKELKIDEFGGYIISFNGANVVEAKTEKLLYENNLTVEQLHRLYNLSNENNVGIHTYSKTHIIAEAEYKFTKFESELVGMDIEIVNNFKEAVNKPSVKAIMVEEPSVLKQIENRVKKETKDMSVTFSKPFFFEFMNNAVDKGKSLKYLCDKLNIKPSEVMAFGDSHNDLPMIEYAGLGIAMGNSVKEVIAIANYTTKTNDDNGIKYAIDKFLKY